MTRGDVVCDVTGQHPSNVPQLASSDPSSQSVIVSQIQESLMHRPVDSHFEVQFSGDDSSSGE